MSHSKAQKARKILSGTLDDGTRFYAYTIEDVETGETEVIRGGRLRWPLDDYLDINHLLSYKREEARTEIYRYYRKTGKRPIMRAAPKTLVYFVWESRAVDTEEALACGHDEPCGSFYGAKVYKSRSVPEGVIYIGSGEEDDENANYIYLPEMRF